MSSKRNPKGNLLTPLWLTTLFVICVISIVIGASLNKPEAATIKRATTLDILEIALDDLEAAAEASLQAETFSWNILIAALDKAWEMTWSSPDQPPPNPILGSRRACWHVNELDSEVNGISFEAWRCKVAPCDPVVDLCLDVDDGVYWEFRFRDDEIATLRFD